MVGNEIEASDNSGVCRVAEVGRVESEVGKRVKLPSDMRRRGDYVTHFQASDCHQCGNVTPDKNNSRHAV